MIHNLTFPPYLWMGDINPKRAHSAGPRINQSQEVEIEYNTLPYFAHLPSANFNISRRSIQHQSTENDSFGAPSIWTNRSAKWPPSNNIRPDPQPTTVGDCLVYEDIQQRDSIISKISSKSNSRLNSKLKMSILLAYEKAKAAP
eukprot:NODE_9655_length_574_cov_19.441242_g9018_i0.p1 GENE.NODE_9655_length_574_cov_19.441242_g9018_i0~~NODE_9655_length_574_cov_19.441242_g9018_i0.p1  ORF type:complete len:144 (-),score=16.23 NODE_9655_length_574_cov_19.441242_g9018_i0:79-510(-)